MVRSLDQAIFPGRMPGIKPNRKRARPPCCKPAASHRKGSSQNNRRIFRHLSGIEDSKALRAPGYSLEIKPVAILAEVNHLATDHLQSLVRLWILDQNPLRVELRPNLFNYHFLFRPMRKISDGFAG